MTPHEPRPRTFGRAELLVALAIVAATIAIYGGVGSHRFVTFDDGKYLLANPMVGGGLTWEGVRWAFTTHHASNWHPLTWLSHMLDCELFGLSPGPHHWMNVALHGASAVLLLAALRRLGLSLGVAAFGAAFFALHPLRAESVAWASERKDVLSGLFWMLGLLAYASWAARGGALRYAAVFASLALGLLAKPMLVSFPLVLLLVDLWPLERLDRARLWPRVREKLPLFALVGAAALATMSAQEGAMSGVGHLPVAARLSNACVAVVVYCLQTLWPAELACFYPHPAIVQDGYTPWSPFALGCMGALAVVSVGAIALRKRAPFLLVGWCWTLVTLLPVVGLVQVGAQAHADRYTYLPMIGVVLAVSSAVAGAAPGALARRATWAAAIVALSLYAWAARVQVATWRNTRTLFEHAVSVTERNFVAHTHLGILEARAGNLEAAEAHLAAAIEIAPNAHSLVNYGSLLQRRGESARARRHYELALESDPRFANVHNALGTLEEQDGRLEAALVAYRRAVELDPWHAGALANLGALLLALDDLDRAAGMLERAAALDGENASIQNNLGAVHQRRGDLQRAQTHLRLALELDPEAAEAQGNLGLVLEELGRTDEAAGHYRRALELDPALAWVGVNLGLLLERQGEPGEAADVYRRLLESEPPDLQAALRLSWVLSCGHGGDATIAEGLRWSRVAAEATDHADPAALDALAMALAREGSFDEAVRWQRRSLELEPEAPPRFLEERRRRLALYEDSRPFAPPR